MHTLQAGRWFGYSFALLCGVFHLYQIMRTFKRVLLWRAGLSPYQQDVTSPLMGLPPSCDSNSSQARAAANDTRVTAKIFLEPPSTGGVSLPKGKIGCRSNAHKLST